MKTFSFFSLTFFAADGPVTAGDDFAGTDVMSLHGCAGGEDFSDEDAGNGIGVAAATLVVRVVVTLEADVTGVVVVATLGAAASS